MTTAAGREVRLATTTTNPQEGHHMSSKVDHRSILAAVLATVALAALPAAQAGAYQVRSPDGRERRQRRRAGGRLRRPALPRCARPGPRRRHPASLTAPRK